MELLTELLPWVIAFAEDPATGTGISSGFFGVLVSGANIFVNIIRWSALLWVLVKIAMLGFKISTNAKTSSEAITIIKNEGLALLIGLFVVMTAFMIHGAMKDIIKAMNDNKTNDTKIDYSNTDVFN